MDKSFYAALKSAIQVTWVSDLRQKGLARYHRNSSQVTFSKSPGSDDFCSKSTSGFRSQVSIFPRLNSPNVFIKYLERQLRRVSRIDIVLDVYKPDFSLKSTARSRRGKGVRRRVESRTKVPSNWQSFLREDENKSELFEFLAEESVKLASKKQIIFTKGRSVIYVVSQDNLIICSHANMNRLTLGSFFMPKMQQKNWIQKDDGTNCRYRCCCFGHFDNAAIRRH